MTFTRKDILGTQEMNAAEIAYLLDATESFLEVSTREVKKVPTLRGKTDHQPLLRAEHTHTDVLRNRWQAAQCRRHQYFHQQQQRGQGGKSERHGA